MKYHFIPAVISEYVFTEKCNLNCAYCFEKEKKQISVDKDLLESLIDNFGFISLYPIGGEPFMDTQLLSMVNDKIKKLNMNKFHRERALESANNHITNGTLIKQNLKYIKDNNVSLQISLDGTREAHKARSYGNGVNSYDDVLEAIKLCQDNDIKWVIHGVIAKENYKELFESCKLYFKIYAENKGLDFAINAFGDNIFQVLFEDDLTDNDISLFLDQFVLMCDWIRTTKEYDLSDEQRKTFLLNWMTRKGDTCMAGVFMKSIGVDKNIYPCHRFTSVKDKNKYSLGSVLDGNWKNFEFFNSLSASVFSKQMYSAFLNVNNWNTLLAWMNWCLGANCETSGTPFYQNCKHNTLIAELNELIIEYSKKYNVFEDLLKKRGVALKQKDSEVT